MPQLRLSMARQATPGKGDVMGKRGPAPKPTNLRILHGEKPYRINKNEPQPREGIPDPPDWMEPDARAVWDYTVPELTAMRLITPADRDALAAYCQWTVQFHRATRVVNATGLLIKNRERDGIVKNPAAQLQRDAGTMMAKYAAEFGLTPRARAEITLTPDVSEDELSRLLS
jgi:P27 family predicted phage terminase small subunit